MHSPVGGSSYSYIPWYNPWYDDSYWYFQPQYYDSAGDYTYTSTESSDAFEVLYMLHTKSFILICISQLNLILSRTLAMLGYSEQPLMCILPQQIQRRCFLNL